MIRKIFYSRQTIFKEDISNVTKVLKSDFITRGPINEKFEKKNQRLRWFKILYNN